MDKELEALLAKVGDGPVTIRKLAQFCELSAKYTKAAIDQTVAPLEKRIGDLERQLRRLAATVEAKPILVEPV